MQQVEQRVRAVLMEKSAPARARHGHYVRVRSRCGGGLLDRAAVNAMRGAVAQNLFTVGVAANQAYTGERKTAAEFGEVFGDVVRAAAVAIGLGGDVGERVLRGPYVNHFDVVHNPVAAGEQAATTFGINGLSGHDGNFYKDFFRHENRRLNLALCMRFSSRIQSAFCMGGLSSQMTWSGEAIFAGGLA